VIRHGAAKGRCALPIRGVAAIAIGGQRAAVISIHVAQRAGYGGVRPGQRECCCAVIESGGRPICRGMANRTILREPGCNVIRHRSAQSSCAVPIGSVTTVASRGIQSVVVAHVARRARRRARRNMHASQCKARRAVIERRRSEAHRGVASGAVRHCK
jgi:hypothetical protein